jgi:hypothetical protein
MATEQPDRESWLDAELRRVAPPAGLVGRLQRIPVADDEVLDDLLRETPLPAGLIGRLRKIPVTAAPRERRWATLERQAVAASLVSMVWFSYAAAFLLFWLDYRPPQTAAANWLQTESPLEDELLPGATETSLALGAASQPSSASLTSSWSAPVAPPAIEAPDAAPPMTTESPGELLAMGYADDLVDLLRVSASGARRAAAEVPLGPHFDRSFLSRTGVFPRVDPQHHPSERVPLTTETSSFTLARQYLRQGRFPRPESIRTEEFLAAVDYGFPRPKQPGLTLSALAGRAAWELPGGNLDKRESDDRRLWLLQLHLQAGGRSGPGPLAASKARLTVRFNPHCVANYRLCGHEPTSEEGEKVTLELDFTPGGSATALYELQLRGDAQGEAAVATLEWIDPASGMRCTRRYPIQRGQFAPRFEQAPVALRLAGLAAAAGEILRESPHAGSISPAALLELARQGQTQTQRKQPQSANEFRKFVEIFARIVALRQRTEGIQRLPDGARPEDLNEPVRVPFVGPATFTAVDPNRPTTREGQRVSCFALLESISWKRCPGSQGVVSASGAGTRLSLWRLLVISPAV